MIHPVFKRFEMAIKHRSVCLDTDMMSDLHHLPPTLSGYLFGAQLVSNALREYLGASSRHDLEPALLELGEYFFEAEPANPRKIIDLNSGKCLDIQQRKFLTYGRDHSNVMFEWPVRMEATDDVDFRKSVNGRQPFEYLVDSEFEGAFLVLG